MKKKGFRKSYDQAWKFALKNRFKELLQVLWREMHDLVDWSCPLVYLDKEFSQQIANEHGKGQILDSLVKVRLLSGENACVFLHTEVQAQKDKDIMSRMYRYRRYLSENYKDCSIRQILILLSKDGSYRPHAYIEHQEPLDPMVIPIKTIKISDYYGKLTYDNVHLEEKNIAYFLILLVLDSMYIEKNDQAAIFEAKKRFIKAMDRCGHNEKDIKMIVRISEFILLLSDQDLSKKWKQEVVMEKSSGSKTAEYLVNEDSWSFKKGELRGIKKGELRGIKKGELQGIKKGELRGEKKACLAFIEKLILDGYSEKEALILTGTSRLAYKQMLLFFEKKKKDV